MSSAKLAIIGGSGFDYFETLHNVEHISQDTPYGPHSGPITKGILLDTNSDDSTLRETSTADIVFLPRHGADHQIPPHLVNYRANIWMLTRLGVERILACNVVGGISKSMMPGTFVVPNQIIDYTYGREHTFFDGSHEHLQHIDFTQPYCQNLRSELLAYFCEHHIAHQSEAVYGCTQGPRLETAAEVRRLYRDGCDIVGMTAMPEAALAKEKGIDYAGLSLVVNWGAGIEKFMPSMDTIVDNMNKGITQLKRFLPGLVKSLASN